MAYIVVFLLFLFLRIFALATHSTDTSDLAFDILACGACILFPRLVFFLIKDNVIILAVRSVPRTRTIESYPSLAKSDDCSFCKFHGACQ